MQILNISSARHQFAGKVCRLERSNISQFTMTVVARLVLLVLNTAI